MGYFHVLASNRTEAGKPMISLDIDGHEGGSVIAKLTRSETLQLIQDLARCLDQAADRSKALEAQARQEAESDSSAQDRTFWESVFEQENAA